MTVAASAVLVRPMLPQLTVIEAVELLLAVLASTAAETVAVLLMLGQSWLVVGRLRVTVRVEPFVIVPKLHESTPAVIEQEPAFAPPRFQVPLGRVSETVTLVESPVPPAVTTRVKVAVPPALTAALPVLRIETFGQLTVVETMLDVLVVLLKLNESMGEVAMSLERFGRRPTEVAYECGLLGPETVAAHCVWLSDSEIRLMRETGTQISHNPTSNAKLVDTGADELARITGQKPVTRRAKKSIAAFKVRKGMAIATMVTLRGERMWEFLDRLMNIALPRVRDFKGVSPKGFDGRGNYTLGLKDQLLFPEIDYMKVDKARGMNVSVVTTAKTDEEARKLLQFMGMPFRGTKE